MNEAYYLDAVVKAIKQQHPAWGFIRIARELKAPQGTVKHVLQRSCRPANPLRPGATSVNRLQPRVEDSPAVQLAKKAPIEFGHLGLEHVDLGTWVRLGLVADTHLACQEERLEALHCQYDLFKAEGITSVLHAGNIVDGYISKINGASVIVSTPDDQAQYVIDNYPNRPGITTHYITGDDHEGWWVKQGLNWGVLLQHMARSQGREDLHYIGHVEADVEVMVEEATKHPIIKVQHPGGGSCYARSYAPQRTIESLEGGEKPDVLVQGHYHVNGFWNERNVHVITLPGFQDQTIFGRKKRLRFEVGGAILEFKTNSAGAITRCRCEFNMFFNRGYYKAFLRSDVKMLKGHLQLNP